MKIAFLMAVSAVAFTGLAQAGAFAPGDDIISETLTGTITGGLDSGDGTYDDAHLFNVGGGSLLGAPVSITFSYDATYIAANGVYYNDLVGMSYDGIASDPSPYQISVTIGGTAFSPSGTYFEDTELSLSSDASSQGAVNEGLTAAEDLSGNLIEFAAGNLDPAITGFDVDQQADVSAMFGDPSDAYVLEATTCGLNCGAATDILFASLSPSSGTPEPTTWLSLATGLCGLALLRFRRGRRS